MLAFRLFCRFGWGQQPSFLLGFGEVHSEVFPSESVACLSFSVHPTTLNYFHHLMRLWADCLHQTKFFPSTPTGKISADLPSRRPSDTRIISLLITSSPVHFQRGPK